MSLILQLLVFLYKKKLKIENCSIFFYLLQVVTIFFQVTYNFRTVTYKTIQNIRNAIIKT